MRKLYIPIMNHLSTPATRGAYAQELRRAGASRVFIAPGRFYQDCAAEDDEMAQLKENIAFYEQNGFEAGIWINGIGHGVVLSHESEKLYPDWLRMRGLENGGESADSFCPLDDRLVDNFRRELRKIIAAGARLIMIDDDLRLCNHGAFSIGCACPRHMQLYNELARKAGLLCGGETITREKLAEKVFTGPQNPWRSLWLRLQGQTMRDFVKKLRDAVDEANPSVRLGHCACLDTWDLDGIDSVEMSRLLAGNTAPFLRLIGAPYWNNSLYGRTVGLGSIIDLERMQLAWCEQMAPDIEVFTEGDLYPRPRYMTPGIFAEDFDQVLLAEEKADGILKYMLDYVHAPDYERGYIDRHVYFAPLRKQIEAAFSARETAGLWLFENIHKLETMDCTGLSAKDIFDRFVPSSLKMTSRLSVPTSFTQTKYTRSVLVFGENARFVTPEMRSLPMVLDAVAAELLHASGVDVGLQESTRRAAPQTEIYPSEDASQNADSSRAEDAHQIQDASPNAATSRAVTIPLGTVWAGQNASKDAAFRHFVLQPGVKVLSRFDDGSPASYEYTSQTGERFLVYAFDAELADPRSALFLAYPRQKQLFDFLGETLPVRVEGEPGLYVLARKDSQSMTVGLWNFGRDIALPHRILLDAPYQSVTFFGAAGGKLQNNVIELDAPLYPGAFTGFTVSFPQH